MGRMVSVAAWRQMACLASSSTWSGSDVSMVNGILAFRNKLIVVTYFPHFTYFACCGRCGTAHHDGGAHQAAIATDMESHNSSTMNN